MTGCFADSFYFLAMLNPEDEAHDQATALTASLWRPLVTTAWVLTEVGDALAETPSRVLFGRLLASLRSDSRAVVVGTTDELFERGVELYEKRPDKGWPLTDCISFVVMGEMGIADALTGDQHFRQAGFRCLL